MNRKLTLLLDGRAIDRAREYAKAHNTSLSVLVKNFFQRLSGAKAEPSSYPPITAELRGILRKTKMIDDKHEYTQYLSDKYS